MAPEGRRVGRAGCPGGPWGRPWNCRSPAAPPGARRRDPDLNGDIGPQRYAREHQNAARIQDGAARAADPLVAGEQGRRVLTLDRLREEARVDIAEGGFEAVGQSFDQDAEQGLGAGLLEQVWRQLRGWLPGDAQAKYFARGSLTRSTSQ